MQRSMKTMRNIMCTYTPIYNSYGPEISEDGFALKVIFTIFLPIIASGPIRKKSSKEKIIEEYIPFDQKALPIWIDFVRLLKSKY